MQHQLCHTSPCCGVQACEVCKETIEQFKGRLLIKEAARIVSDREDRLLTEQMTALERANEEVSGDEDSEEEDVGMGDVDVEGAAAIIES